MYKITFQMESPICFIDRPLFDSMIAYCWTKDKFGALYPKIDFRDRKNYCFYDNIPIKKHKDGYFLASFMFFDESLEFEQRRRRRWHCNDDDLADFGGKKRKVQINGFEFKSRDIPMNLHSIPQVWFYFCSDNVQEVQRLILEHLAGIGKDIDKGNGWYSYFKITEEKSISFKEECLRPIPAELAGKYKYQNVYTSYCACHPPYYCTQRTVCIVPDIENGISTDFFEGADTL